jgi:hypothetical protein
MASPLERGVGDFVRALGSRGAVRQDAERRAVGTADQMLRAQIRADELRSREGLGDALTALGVENGESLGTVMRGGFGNFQQGTAGLGNLADLALLNRGEELAANPSDVDELNRIIALRAKKPLARTQISGNTAFDPYAAPSAEGLISTPLGDSMILENQASAAKSGRVSGSTRAPERFSQPTQGSLKNAFGKDGKLDQSRYNLFLRWRQDNPEIRNGEEALQTFVNGADVFTINEHGSWRPNPNRYSPGPDDGVPVVGEERGLGDVMAGDTFYQGADGQQVKARSPRISQVGGRPVVSVDTPEEAKAAWARLAKGAGIRLPNGTIKFKE